MVSKKLFSAVLATLVILSTVGGTSLTFAQTQTSTATAKPTQTLVQVAANNTNLTNFMNLLKKTNITQELNRTGNNYTVFAPDNAAFSKVDTSTLARWQNNTTELRNMLWYHVIPKKLLSTDFTGNGTLTTVNGLSVPYSVDGTKIKVGNATITKADINATNGVIHVVDSVNIPPTATASATAAGGFLGMPGFEALYAVAGLLAVAYLVIRRRK
jgi:PGF-CTERM protein